MPSAVLTPEEWNEVRRSDENGVPIETLCEQWGLTAGTIRQRRKREGWVTPRKLQEEAMVEQARRKSYQIPNDVAVTGVTVNGQKALKIGSEELLGYWNRTQMAILPPLTEQVELAVTENPEAFRPKNLKEMTQLVGITGTLTGANRPSTAVQVNVTQWGKYQQSEGDGKTYDV